MNPEEMEKAMIKNMLKRTGKDLKGWIKIIHAKGLHDKSNIIQFLKTEHLIGHVYAHLIAAKCL